MKGEIRHPRTRAMMGIALMNAKAAFESSCAPKAPKACMVYEGSAWNGGTHVTVIIDRCLCEEHDDGRADFARVEQWLYDISGDSPMRLGRIDLPGNAQLLMEPGDVPDAAHDAKPFLKN